MTQLSITAHAERFPIAGTFTISRGAKREAVVVVVEVSDGNNVGRGEAVPYARYGETIEGTLAAIATLGTVEADPAALLPRLPAGAARNAVDCALIDLAAKRRGRPASELLGLPAPAPVLTCYTLSLDTPDAMAARAREVADLPLLKLKLGGEGDRARMEAVRRARPDARIVADANEAWRPEMLFDLLSVAADCGLELIEQPLPVGAEDRLRERPHAVPVCADESFHTRAELAAVAGLYDAVNIKLDKAGGLTEARATMDAARQQGLRVMLGCMVATSLAMAPALLLAGSADWVDLDGPLLLATDRPGGLLIRGGVITPPSPGLWG